MRCFLMYVTASAMCVTCAAQESSVEKLLEQSEPAIQTWIGKVSDALNQSDPKNNIVAQKVAANLNEAFADKHEIVKQVAIFAAGPDEQQPLTALAVLQLLNLPPNIVIETLAPYLNADNIKLRSFVLDWFQNHDNGGSDESPLQPVNYADYADYVRKRLNRNEDIPNGFVEYLFERSPGRALLAFNRADRRGETVDRLQEMRRELEQRGNIGKLPQPKAGVGQSDIFLAEHMISNAIWFKKHHFDHQFQDALPAAKQQLSKLSEQQQWWVRLYVAEIMRRYREFRQTEVLEKLSHDSNAVVSKSAKSAID